ncbi:alpha/beta hydrolase [Kribbella amoyensis]|uniref:alpha/beta hydrolase n=1 Tax=Kribbella amoyensis TaxID=996641 RepID=UPI001EE17BA9|nr:alpha/beta fold hydrolase [Kribbella amoyensis]
MALRTPSAGLGEWCASASTCTPVAWHDCRTGPADEEGKQLAESGASCATVKVPLDHTKPRGRTIDVAISRIPADPAKRRGVLLTNPGGPGGPGITYPLALRPLLGEVAAQYDLIGIDQRFMGRSDPLDCGPVRLADVLRTSVTRTNFVTSDRKAKDFATACRERNPGLLEHASIRNAARDLDAVRTALGEQKISYYGVSWGADLGVVYAQLFPDRVDRMVVDSVTDVEGSEYRHLATGERVEAAFDEWAAWVAWRDDKYHLGRTGMEVRRAVTRLLERPITVGEYRVDSAALPWLLQSALGDESDRELMARNVSTLIHGSAPTEELQAWLAQYYSSVPMLSRFAAASFAFTCNDRGWPSGPTQYWRDVQRTRRTEPLFATTILQCAYWRDRTTEPELTIGNDVPLLIVQAERDNIPLSWAESLHRKLPKSTLRTVDRRGHGVYDERVPAMVKTVNTFLSTGAVP